MMYNTYLDRASLLDYFESIVAREDQSTELLNPLFTGRNDELDLLHANVRRAEAGALANRTAIVHGVPGAGKSELMLQFMHQQGEINDEDTVVVRGTPAALQSAPLFMRSLLCALPQSELISKALAEIDEQLQQSPWCSEDGGSSTAPMEESLPPMSHTNQLIWLIVFLETLPSTVKGKLFVVCVDDFQNIEFPENSLCEPLNANELGLRVVPVYFDTTLRTHIKARLPRLESRNSIGIGAFEEEHATELLHEFCDVLGVEFEPELDRDALVADTALRLECWPHHLASWMRAACEILPANEFSMTAKVREEIDRVCNEYRRNYHESMLLTCRFLKRYEYRLALGSLLIEKQVVSIVDLSSSLKPTYERFGEDFNIRDFIDNTLDAGVLVERYDGDLEVPIQSLVGYLSDSGSS